MSTILSIETSCDETSLAVVSYDAQQSFSVLAHLTHSQASLHAEYGGVFPAMARREHQKNIIPLLFKTLEQASLLQARDSAQVLDEKTKQAVHNILERDEEIAEKIILLAEQYHTPSLSALAVTYGPGLEIALWTGFNTARALALVWDIPLVPTNHMEGHIYASLLTQDKQSDNSLVLDEKLTIKPITYPALALLLSGGHTELVLIHDEHDYELIGQTLDDAVGEAFDKTARLMGLPYPGGPHVSQQAALARTHPSDHTITLPRPMMHSKDYNFSFSGLKTAVRKVVEEQTRLSKKFKQNLSLEFEEAVTDVLIHKTTNAIEQYRVADLIIGGGVSANSYIRAQFGELCANNNINLHVPHQSLSGDNALMINIAGHQRFINKKYPSDITRVDGNLGLEDSR